AQRIDLNRRRIELVRIRWLSRRPRARQELHRQLPAGHVLHVVERMHRTIGVHRAGVGLVVLISAGDELKMGAIDRLRFRGGGAIWGCVVGAAALVCGFDSLRTTRSAWLAPRRIAIPSPPS